MCHSAPEWHLKWHSSEEYSKRTTRHPVIFIKMYLNSLLFCNAVISVHKAIIFKVLCSKLQAIYSFKNLNCNENITLTYKIFTENNMPYGKRILSQRACCCFSENDRWLCLSQDSLHQQNFTPTHWKNYVITEIHKNHTLKKKSILLAVMSVLRKALTC